MGEKARLVDASGSMVMFADDGVSAVVLYSTAEGGMPWRLALFPVESAEVLRLWLLLLVALSPSVSLEEVSTDDYPGNGTARAKRTYCRCWCRSNKSLR